jgi:hypothetical protein
MTLKFEFKINRIRMVYCRHGVCHRPSGPARIYVNGICDWYQYGKIHRDDGPALIYSDGTKYWFKHGIKQWD